MLLERIILTQKSIFCISRFTVHCPFLELTLFLRSNALLHLKLISKNLYADVKIRICLLGFLRNIFSSFLPVVFVNLFVNGLILFKM